MAVTDTASGSRAGAEEVACAIGCLRLPGRAPVRRRKSCIRRPRKMGHEIVLFRGSWILLAPRRVSGSDDVLDPVASSAARFWMVGQEP